VKPVEGIKRVFERSERFPPGFQGAWRDPDEPTVSIEILGRTLRWCGDDIDFDNIVGSYDSNGRLTGIQLTPSTADDPAFHRYSPFAMALADDDTRLWAASLKYTHVLTRCTDAQD